MKLNFLFLSLIILGVYYTNANARTRNDFIVCHGGPFGDQESVPMTHGTPKEGFAYSYFSGDRKEYQIIASGPGGPYDIPFGRNLTITISYKKPESKFPIEATGRNYVELTVEGQSVDCLSALQ